MQNQPISDLDLDQVLAKCILSGSKPVCKNHWAWFLAFLEWKTCCLCVGIQPSTSFPLSDLVAFFHRWPGSYCAKPAWTGLGSGSLCQVLVKQIQSGSKLVCKSHPAHFWQMLPSQSGLDANHIRHVLWELVVIVQV